LSNRSSQLHIYITIPLQSKYELNNITLLKIYDKMVSHGMHVQMAS
jgi:hypothetical protein